MKSFLTMARLAGLLAAAGSFAQNPLINSNESEAAARHKAAVDSAALQDSAAAMAKADSADSAGAGASLAGRIRRKGDRIAQEIKENKSQYEVGIFDPTYFSPVAFRSRYDLPAGDINRIDPPHCEFLVSPFLAARLYPRWKAADTLKFFAVYRGLYNFYFQTEASGPVVSRIQNLDFFFDLRKHAWDFQIGAGHESNGMFIDSATQYANLTRTVSHRPDGKLPMNPQDFASMGWNYDRVMVSRTWDFGGGWGVVTGGLGARFFVNQDFSSFFDGAHSEIEDTSFYFQVSDKGIERYSGLTASLSYFKAIRNPRWYNAWLHSIYLQYSPRMGYLPPFNHSGSLLIAGNSGLLKALYSGLRSIPLIKYPALILDGLNAGIPVYVKWDYGYSENPAYYAVPYAGVGKVSAGVIILGMLKDHQ